MKIVRFPLLALLASAPLHAAPSQDLWTEILGSPEGTIPADPGGKVAWRADFDAALAEAKATNRPVLVTWRCLPCKHCADVPLQPSTHSSLMRSQKADVA